MTHTFPRFEGDAISSIFMAEVAQGLVDAGNRVWVLTPWTKSFKNRKKDYKIVTYKYIFPDLLHRLGYSETLSNDKELLFLAWILSPFMYLFGFVALLKLIKKEKIEVINAHWILPNGFIAAIASVFTGVPVVSTLPGSDVYMAKKNLLFNILARIATAKSSWITSNSNELIEDLSKSTDIDLTPKSSWVPYGRGYEAFGPDKKAGVVARNELGYSKNDIVVLGVGRLVEKKGFEYLIKAAPKIISKNKKIHFVLVGDGELKQDLENMAKHLGVSDRFKFLGTVSYQKMNMYYNMADIFILPSIRDKKGNLDDQSVAVMDAMACGKPVITSDFKGYKQVIQSGKDGILIPEKSVSNIVRSVLALSLDSRRRRILGMSAGSKIQNDFSWTLIGGKYSDLFKMVIKPSYSLGIPKILDEKGRIRVAKQILGVLMNQILDMRRLSLLDVACSSGVISSYLSTFFSEVVGIDTDQNAIEIAKRKNKKKNLEFLEMDAENLKFKDKKFDIVVCNQVYNFVEHPQKMINEIYRVLKPGGMCFFGARNKFALVEPQYNIPFGSWLPKLLPFGKKYMSYLELRSLVSRFKLHEFTIKILRNPKKFGFVRLKKYEKIARLLPLSFIKYLLPNYIWILEKPRAKS